MSEQFEAVFYGYQQTELFYHIWQCSNPKGTLLVSHGLAEHSECYKEFAEDLNRLNFNVIAYDLRGHGRSEGQRGVVENFEYYCHDLNLFTEYCLKEYKKNLPFFLFGHSMGGLISAKTLISHEIKGIDAVIFSSPCFGLKIEVPAWKEKLVSLTSQWLPNLTMWNELRYDDLIRDTDKIKTYESDPLRHDKISPRLFLGMLTSIEYVESNEHEFHLPVLVQVAGQDRICSPASGVRFYENCSSKIKKLQIYEESLHEIYNDLDRQLVIKDLQKFLQRFVKSNEQESKQ
ncbi:MAG: lysophospholipase [Bdellovibrionaceae bacterium]|nr:lysophospholipase [Pseudobdellovibrionaceae bacterium]